ncbi:MAG: helix-turn-helix transcriptional regulator [Candidatus Hodarchaeota archaeon]
MAHMRNTFDGCENITKSSNEDDEEISKVLFELASNRRASILFEVEKQNLRMQQIAKSLDMNVTETFRHLQRLSDAKLVEKKVDGTYAITSLGNLTIGLLSNLDFILKNGDFFLEHDVSCLPYEFVNRLGELSGGEFCGNTLTTLNRVRQIVFDAEEYIWAMAEQSESSHVQVTNEKVAKGLQFRFIMQQNFTKTIKIAPEVEHLKERRCLERICVTFLISEKESVVHFRRRNGEMHYIGFFGKDEKFHKWTRDLFMHYWERAEPWFPSIQKT